MALSVASAVCAALAIGRDASAIRALTVLFAIASVFNQPISSALGGLVASVVPDSQRGRTGGWSQAGILGGGVVAGGVAVWLVGNTSLLVTALVVAVLIAAPAFTVLAIDEPSSPHIHIRSQLARMRRSLMAMLKQREAWLGFVFFLSPIGTGALMDLFSAVAVDYHASSGMVVLVVALAGIAMPAGALFGGILCDRFDRWRMYPIAGLLSALSASAMLLAPLRPVTYIVGATANAFTIGICYAAFMSLAFELVGSASAASGTRFTLFMAAVNVPVVYMLRLDGIGHQHWGVRGMLAVDAISNALFSIVLLIIIGVLRSRYARRSGAARWVV